MFQVERNTDSSYSLWGLLPQLPAPPQGPIAESRFSSSYFCNILGVQRIGDDEVDIKFEVFGDGSLGPLQVRNPNVIQQRFRMSMHFIFLAFGRVEIIFYLKWSIHKTAMTSLAIWFLSGLLDWDHPHRQPNPA
jgi:hypothetical protein